MYCTCDRLHVIGLHVTGLHVIRVVVGHGSVVFLSIIEY